MKSDPLRFVSFPSWFGTWYTDRFRVLEKTDLRLVLCGRDHTLGPLIVAVVTIPLVLGVCLYLTGVVQGADRQFVMTVFTFGMAIFLVLATLWIASKPYRFLAFDVTENAITEKVVRLFPRRVDIRTLRFSDVTAVEARQEIMWRPKQPQVHLVAVFIQLGSDRLAFQTAKQAEQTLAHVDWIRGAARRARRYAYPY